MRRCEEQASASSYHCGDTDVDDTEDAVFADNDCVFDPCKKPPTKCGRRNAFGVNELESFGSEYKVGSKLFKIAQNQKLPITPYALSGARN